MKTVGHILKEISIHVYYLIKIETDFFNGTVLSTKFRTIPAGEL